MLRENWNGHLAGVDIIANLISKIFTEEGRIIIIRHFDSFALQAIAEEWSQAQSQWTWALESRARTLGSQAASMDPSLAMMDPNLGTKNPTLGARVLGPTLADPGQRHRRLGRKHKGLKSSLCGPRPLDSGPLQRAPEQMLEFLCLNEKFLEDAEPKSAGKAFRWLSPLRKGPRESLTCLMGWRRVSWGKVKKNYFLSSASSTYRSAMEACSVS